MYIKNIYVNIVYIPVYISVFLQICFIHQSTLFMVKGLSTPAEQLTNLQSIRLIKLNCFQEFKSLCITTHIIKTHTHTDIYIYIYICIFNLYCYVLKGYICGFIAIVEDISTCIFVNELIAVSSCAMSYSAHTQTHRQTDTVKQTYSHPHSCRQSGNRTISK